MYAAFFQLRAREQAVYHLERALVLALGLLDVHDQRIAERLADAERRDIAAAAQCVARAAVGCEVAQHLARVVVFVHRQLAQARVRPVVRATLGDGGCVVRRYRLEAAVGIELFELMDEVALFAVFFSRQIREV